MHEGGSIDQEQRLYITGDELDHMQTPSVDKYIPT
jgi:hypothetical protein